MVQDLWKWQCRFVVADVERYTYKTNKNKTLRETAGYKMLNSSFLLFTLKNVVVFSFFYCCSGVHCDIYKSSYKVSKLNSPLHHSPLSSFPHSWNGFNRSHFSVFIHEYRIFLPYSCSYTLSLCPPPSYWNQSPRQDPFYLPGLHFWKRDSFVCLR
jgi:hypothetical protein